MMERTLHRDFYFSDEIFRREQERIFYREWFCAGRDEVYAVIQGSGWFRNGSDRHRFGPGDVLFVPAGVVHRFEEFTDDMMVWVFFDGPEGGEAET